MMEFDLKQLVLAQNELLAEIVRRLDRLEKKQPQVIRQFVGGGLSKGYADSVYLPLDGSRAMTGSLDMGQNDIDLGVESATSRIIYIGDHRIRGRETAFKSILDITRRNGADLSTLQVYEMLMKQFSFVADNALFNTRGGASTTVKFRAYDSSIPDWVECARLQSQSGNPHFIVYRAGDFTMLDQKMMKFGTYTDAQRPAAGTAGRWIFNTDDGMPNYDDGTNWRDINGNIT